MKKLLATTALAAAMFAGAQSAKADLIQVGLQEAGVNGNAVTLATSSTNGSIGWNIGTTYGVFHTAGDFTDSLGFGLPAVLDGNSLDVTSSAAGTMYIYVDASDQTAISGASTWSTQFSTNDTTGIVDSHAPVTESVYLDQNNDDLSNLTFGPNGTVTNATLLQSVSLTSNTSVGPFFNTADITGPYSIIEVFALTSTAKNEHFNDTINENAMVPEPASLFLLGSGLLAVGGWSRRKRAS